MMRVDRYDRVVELCREAGVARGQYYVARIQERSDLAVLINNGQTEEINTSTLSGIGLQVFTPEGYMGFAAADRISETIVADLFEKAVFLAKTGQKYQTETNREIHKLTPLKKRLEIPSVDPLQSLTLTEIEAKLKELNQQLAAIDSRLSVRTMMRLTKEEWRICRADGTDVIFNTPRSYIYHSFTAKSGEKTATTYANLPGMDLGILVRPEKLERLQKRAEKAARLALDLLGAAKFPGGNYKIVIDYALAKGLAHEAFGHAAETDAIESSILGENGRFRTGLKVADSRLSIVDGPLEGDYAYQPISAIGTERKTVRIVDHGVLTTGLADVFSAARAGVAPSGAERVENFFHLPIARMSNIRIEFDNPIALEQDFYTVTPADLYRILKQRHLIDPGETVLYLTGFQGGQVNPAFGDFMFNCSAVYRLSEQPVLYQPAIFSGKVLSVLDSVMAALGELQIDAMGTCGKMGQGVPSCGGSHAFLVIAANPEIMIGGE
jgi:TldD protein